MKERPNHRPMPRLVTIFLLLLAQVVWAAVIPSAHAGAPEALYPPRDHSQDLDIPAPAFRRGELLVKFEDNGGIIATPGRQTLARAGAQRLHGEREASDGRAAELWQVEVGQELALATRLSALPDVAYAEPNYLVYAHLTPNDPLYNPQWAHNVIGSEGAWDLSTGSGSIVVAVVDTGVDLDNPELQGRVTGGKSFVPGVSSPDDDQGHGTHVAGIIAAAGNNGLGVAGMAWSAQIMPIKVLDATGVGDSSDVAHGIRYAVDNGAHILNISLGGPGASTTLYEAVQYASNNGVLVVGSAGNCGDGNYAKNGCDYENQVIYPAAYDAEVLAVAATNTYDTVASFSNQGSYVDVAAPGVGILSTIPTGYAYADGTSQAAPFVAGLAALLLSVKPSLTPPQVEAIISATAV
ncbi:MAG: peptidase S8, partial [Anaerolineae bacterium]|nr:peptidase S8 [Anaerolineae bacterium]